MQEHFGESSSEETRNVVEQFTYYFSPQDNDKPPYTYKNYERNNANAKY